jgi:predicted nucleic acid-binding protein
LKAFVLDNSVVMAWALGEDHAGADAVMDLLVDAEAVVPSVWPLEFANVLLVAERRRRISEAQAAQIQALVLALPISIVPEAPARVLSTVLALAREHGLSVYDGTYLDLAMREGVPLATLDRRLAEAAQRCGVPLLVEI